VKRGEKERWNSLAAPGKGKQYVPPIHFAILPPDPCMRRYVSSTSLSLSLSLSHDFTDKPARGGKQERKEHGKSYKEGFSVRERFGSRAQLAISYSFLALLDYQKE
jgi:hypothetical protein